MRGTPNRVTADVRALAQEFGPEAVMRLAAEMRHAPDSRARTAAAMAILDRGYGRPGAETRVLDLPGGSMVERATAVINAAADGVLPVAEAAALVAAMAGLGKILETQELARDMAELEGREIHDK